MIIDSKMSVGKNLSSGTDKEIAVEQMVRAMSMENVYNQENAPLTITALQLLPDDWQNMVDNVVVDSRVHMLMKGWFPCIPGYHHDDVPRPENQPDYFNQVRTEHAMFLYNAHVAPTSFAIGVSDFTLPEDGEVIYRKWHEDVLTKLSNNELKQVDAPDRTWIFFNDRTWHQGVACTVKFGHRLFIRVARSYVMIDGKKTYIETKFHNEIRRNAQVYMNNPMEGW